MNWDLRTFDVLDSTNEEAWRLADAGAPEGVAVLAKSQTAGRGRRGRSWESPEGNLFLSLLLRPAVPPAEAAKLSFLAAVALGETIELAAPGLTGRVRCKWPNDVLVDGAKVSGVLLESRTRPDGALDWVIAGIGANLVHKPIHTLYPATALADHGDIHNPVDFAGWLLARFGYWYARWKTDGFVPVREAWLKRAHGLGQQIVVRLPEGELHGRFAALDDSGALLLELPDGRRQAITAGDVFPVG